MQQVLGSDATCIPYRLSAAAAFGACLVVFAAGCSHTALQRESTVEFADSARSGSQAATARVEVPEVRRVGASMFPDPMAPLLDGGERTLPRRGGDWHRPSARRAVADRIEADVLPITERAYPRIASRAKGSISIGTVTEGFLVSPAEITPIGPHHRILERIAPRNARFTTDEMRDLILCAAAAVAKEHPKTTLGVGNLSRAAGGDTLWSVSHNNGRDADLAFYARDLQGAPTIADHLYDYRRDLTSEARDGKLIFDVAANWSLVKGLIQCEKGANIEFLFAANWLERAMLEFARAKGEDAALIARAGTLLHQPRRAANHADHLHIRIGCADDDVAEGCLRPSRAPDQAIGQSPAVRRRIPAIRAGLQSPDPKTRAGAAELLALYHDVAAADQVAPLLHDPTAAVRRAAALALLRLAPARAPEVAVAMAHEPEPSVATTGLHRLLDVAALPALAAIAADATSPHRALVATLLGSAAELTAAPPLLALLRSDDALVRDKARQGLERLCNHSTQDLILAQGDDAGQVVVEPSDVRAWRTFLASLPADATRLSVVLLGFAERGLRFQGLGKPEIPLLAAALASTAPYADNAAWLLTQALRYEPEYGRGARAAPAAFWWPWLRRRSLLDEATFARLQAGEAAPSSALAGVVQRSVPLAPLASP